MVSATLIGMWAAAAAGPVFPGHDTRLWVSPAGVEFLEAQLAELVPTHLEPPGGTYELMSCTESTPITFTQRDTAIDLQVKAMYLDLVGVDTLRVTLTLAGEARGEAYVENAYACLSSATCTDHMSISEGTVVFDVAIGLDEARRIKLEVVASDMQLGEDNIEIWLDDCLLGPLVDWLFALGKSYILDRMREYVDYLARDIIAPELEQQLNDLVPSEGEIGVAFFATRFSTVTASTAGLNLAAEADLWSPYPLAACLDADPGEPLPGEGAVPSLEQDPFAHVALAVNLSLLEDALYHVWRGGLMCVSDEQLQAIGLTVDVSSWAGMLPGFAPGSKIDLGIRAGKPVRLRGSAGKGAHLTIDVDDLSLALTGTLPNGTSRGFLLDTDVSLSAGIRYDPLTNALMVRIESATIDRARLDDGGLGLDVDRLVRVITGELLPTMLDDLGELPLLAPVVGVTDYYVLPRWIETSASYLALSGSLYRAPANDTTAPSTRVVTAPTRPVSVKDARVVVEGTDDLIPSALVRFVVTVNGVSRTPNQMREIRVGEAGVTGSYEIDARAMDLAGNLEAGGAHASVFVDGVPPSVHFVSDSVRQLVAGDVDLEWSMWDDLSPASAIVASIDLYALQDPTSMFSGVLIQHLELGPGQSQTTVTLADAGVYQAVLTVRDEVGNHAATQGLFAVSTGHDGCAQTRPSALLVPMLVLAVMGAVRRRSRSERPDAS
jgi:hypothetical protein